MREKKPDWIISNLTNPSPDRSQFQRQLEAITAALGKLRSKGIDDREAVCRLVNAVREAVEVGVPYILIREASFLKEDVLGEIIEGRGIPESWWLTED